VRLADKLVEDLVSGLRQLGLGEDTALIVSADHGEEFGEHGDFSHGQSLHRELLHVPLIIAGPVVQDPGQRVSTPVSLLDILPTLVEISGGILPPGVHGRSLLPFLQGQELQAQAIFSESTSGRIPHERKAIRWQGYVLIYNIVRGDSEFYDRSQDPVELVDRFQTMPVVSQELLSQLCTWTEETARLAAEWQAVPSTTEIDDRAKDALRDMGY